MLEQPIYMTSIPQFISCHSFDGSLATFAQNCGIAERSLGFLVRRLKGPAYN